MEDLIKRVVKFRDDRNWKQFHNPKDCAVSLSLEASEFLEHFQWKNKEEIEKYIVTNKLDLGKELADVLYWVCLISNDLDIDISKVFKLKLVENAKKYPIKKAKGNHIKYDKL